MPDIELKEIQRLVALFDPQKPLEGDDPHYIPLDAARGDQACIALLRRRILTGGERSCQLFTGFPGTGKTTELKRLQKAIHEAPPPDGGYVLFVPFGEYIDLFRPLSVTDILRVLAFCVSQEADRVDELAAPPGEAYLRDLYKKVQGWLPEKAQLKTVGFDVYGVKLMAELKDNPDVYGEVEAAIRLRFQHFVDECRRIIQDGIARIRRKVGGKADRFVILADDLENIRPPGNTSEEHEAIETSVVDLFVAHSTFLRLPCHVIYTFPVWLRFRTAQLGALYGGEPLTLPMVKLHPRPGSDDPPGAVDGVKLLSNLLLKRLSPREVDIFGEHPEQALRPIVDASGGYPRDALRLVRTLLQDAPSFPVSAAAITRELKNLRRYYHNLVLATHRDLLVHVRDTHELPSDDEAQRRAFGQLFANFLVFAYRNGEEWFDLHPLIRDAKALAPRLPGEPGR